MILVSHDLGAIEATCERAVWLNEGQIVSDAPVRESLAAYRAFIEADAEKLERLAGKVTIDRASTAGPDGAAIVRSNAGFEADMSVTSDGEYRAWFFLGVSEGTASPVFLINPGHEVPLRLGSARLQCKIPSLPLPRGRFYLWLGAYQGTAARPRAASLAAGGDLRRPRAAPRSRPARGRPARARSPAVRMDDRCGVAGFLRGCSTAP